MKTITPDLNKRSSNFFNNLSKAITDFDKESFFNQPFNSKRVIDEIKRFDNQFIDKATKKLKKDYYPNKQYKQLKFEIYYLSDFNELKITDMYTETMKKSFPKLATINFDLFYSNIKLKDPYFAIEDKELRYEFIFNKVKEEIEKTFKFWTELSLSLDNMKKIFAVQSGKFPCEIIDDESIEDYFKSCATKKDGLDILLFFFKSTTLSKKEKKRFDRIYNKVLIKLKEKSNQ